MRRNSHSFVVALCLLLFFLSLTNGIAARPSESVGELTQTQAVARARNILRNNSGPCGITQTQSMIAVRAKAGWRVTAKIKMSGTVEMAVWLVNAADGAAPQNQLTSEIEKGCP